MLFQGGVWKLYVVLKSLTEIWGSGAHFLSFLSYFMQTVGQFEGQWTSGYWTEG